MALCFITWKEASKNIKIYKWRFYLIFINRNSIEIPVSEEWYFLFYKNYSLWRQIFDTVSNFLRKIPLIGWPFILLLSSFVLLFWFPLVALFDRLSWTNILKRWLLVLNNKNELIYNTSKDSEIKLSSSLIEQYFDTRKKCYYLLIICFIIAFWLIAYFDQK
jgi:hypothetical protein